MSETLPVIMDWIKNLGLPVVALFYLFRLYREEREKNTLLAIEEARKTAIREDKYVKVLEDNTAVKTQLIIAIQNMSAAAREESNTRSLLLDKLVDRALSHEVRTH